MCVRVHFIGGPAAGAVHDYPHLEIALPSLYRAAPEYRTRYGEEGTP